MSRGGGNEHPSGLRERIKKNGGKAAPIFLYFPDANQTDSPLKENLQKKGCSTPSCAHNGAFVVRTNTTVATKLLRDTALAR